MVEKTIEETNERKQRDFENLQHDRDYWRERALIVEEELEKIRSKMERVKEYVINNSLVELLDIINEK